MADFNDLTLYYRPTCPYCRRVLEFMDENNIHVQLRNVLEPGVADELLELGGQEMVPCLMVGNQPLYGSDQIIMYLSQAMAA